MKEQLDKLVLQMYRSGASYPEAVREFQKAFIIAVLRDVNGNQVRAAKQLGITATPCDEIFWSWT